MNRRSLRDIEYKESFPPASVKKPVSVEADSTILVLSGFTKHQKENTVRKAPTQIVPFSLRLPALVIT